VTAVVSLTRVRVVVDHTMLQKCPTAKINKVYTSHTDILISAFTPSILYLLSKTYWASVLLRNFFSLTSI